MPNPGDIQYIEYIDNEGKKRRKKQKFYQVLINYGSYRDTNPNIVTYVKGVVGEFEEFYTQSNKADPEFLSILPDKNIDLRGILNIYNYVNLITNVYYEYAFQNFEVLIDTLSESHSVDNAFIIAEIKDNLDDGQFYEFPFYFVYTAGVYKIEGWANFSKQKQEDIEFAPAALDSDYLLQDVDEKQIDLQYWADNNLLPPIFGFTNCVYFPSNLGDTKSDDIDTEKNPIIKSYPVQGLINNSTNYEFYKLDYPVTDTFAKIEGKKDDIITFNCLIPGINDKTCRFDLESDGQEYIKDYIDAIGDKRSTIIQAPDPLPGSCDGKDLSRVLLYKLNQIVELRFIEKIAAEDIELIKEQKFNQYKMIGKIVSLNLANDNITKSQISVQLIVDYKLKESEYFNAKTILIGTRTNNFVQNQTYCIQRYYKKDLGIGPRLGGSIIRTGSNLTNGEFNPNGNYIYTGVLKDDERLNIPYNILFNADFAVNQDVFNLTETITNINHQFSKSDLPGQFTSISENLGLASPLRKQFIDKYRCYLIKNLDEHSYEYYQNLKKASGISSYTGLHVFREATDNVDITFNTYS